MILHTIWGFDKFEKEWMLLDTWSDWNVEENAEGYDETLAKLREDDMITAVRVVDVNIKMADVRKALANPKIEGEVK